MKKRATLVFVCGEATAPFHHRSELMKQFASRYEKCYFVSPACDSNAAKKISDAGYEHIVIECNKQSLSPMGDWRFVKELRSALKKLQPDDVFVFNMKPIMYTAVICRLLKLRCHVLFTGLGFLFSDEWSLKKAVIRGGIARILRFGLRKAATVMFQNPDDRQTFLDHRIIDANTHAVVVNGSGISLRSFPYHQPSRQQPYTFLLAGRMIRDKGIPEFMAAAKVLKSKYGDDVRFQLLGPFDNNPNAMDPDTIMASHDQGIVEYLGKTDDVRPFLQACTVFVLPSFYMEGTPKIVLESLSTGRPIITTHSRGCRETVVPEQNGFLVDPKNTQQLQDAMEYFVQHPESIQPMGAASRKLAVEKFDVHHVNNQMLTAMGLPTSTEHPSPDSARSASIS